MFTGLIQTCAVVADIKPDKDGARITFSSQTLPDDIAEGDSVSVNGVCSTALTPSQNGFDVQYLAESLARSTLKSIKIGDVVNIELSLKPTDRMGGHFVTGHVDTTGDILSFERTDDSTGVLKIGYPESFAPLIIEKGSIAIDGISLTVVACEKTWFTTHIIDHTWQQTNLKTKTTGDQVNLEFDMIGKYLYRFYTLS